jgi:hypothetical protein
MATRRDARYRVFRDRSTDTGTDSSTGDYDTAGDDEAEVQNVSGEPGLALTPRATTTPRPGQDSPPRPGRKRNIEISATSGARLDQKAANLLTRAATTGARHLTAKETVENSDPHVREAYLDHVFGLNLPGRDRT